MYTCLVTVDNSTAASVAELPMPTTTTVLSSKPSAFFRYLNVLLFWDFYQVSVLYYPATGEIVVRCHFYGGHLVTKTNSFGSSSACHARSNDSVSTTTFSYG
ncbi:hypothetical protein TYRP_001912 [Tyrophagus putrescentiae]|nr:hypothetical protein TYRP_001912 [Tyrophagus putrescentiae]